MDYFLCFSLVIDVIRVLDIFKHKRRTQSADYRRYSILAPHVADTHYTSAFWVKLCDSLASLVRCIYFRRIVVPDILLDVLEEYRFLLLILLIYFPQTRSKLGHVNDYLWISPNSIITDLRYTQRQEVYRIGLSLLAQI